MVKLKLKSRQDKVKFFLKIGTSIGHSFQHIIDIINGSKYKDKLGVKINIIF
jgi:hypothetical protein